MHDRTMFGIRLCEAAYTKGVEGDMLHICCIGDAYRRLCLPLRDSYNSVVTLACKTLPSSCMLWMDLTSWDTNHLLNRKLRIR
jgi:hypothetical protein